METSGRYHFTLPALESNAKLTICKLENDKLKTVKRISVNPNTKEEKRGIFNLLLDAGTCLISFESKSWKNGRNTGYAATLSGTAFGKADRSDDQWQNAVALESPGTTDDWIGFSDLQDWKRFTVDSDTLCSLGLSEVTGSGTTPPSLSAEHQGRRGENPVENSFRKSKRRNHRTGGNPFRRNLLSCCQSGRKHQKSGTDCKLNLEFSEPDAQGMPA